MSEIAIANFPATKEKTTSLRVASVLNGAVFGGLLLLLAASAIPYGTAEPWWKAAFVSSVFVICIVAIVESLISGDWRIGGSHGVLLSMLALSGFAFIQTISIRSGNADPAISNLGPWNAISADPYQTRFFVLQLLALTICIALLYRYCTTKKRINIVIHSILGIAVASALFGIIRQTLQHEPGFVLPRTMPGHGYGQFINKNHFAFLTEMAFGLGLGMGLVGGLKRERAMIYVALLLPIWSGLVLSNSRGGILAMIAQVIVASFLLTGQLRQSKVMRAVLLVLLVGLIVAGTVWVGGDRLISSFVESRRELAPNEFDYRVGASRTEIWRATWKMFQAHPVLGVGLGGYWTGITSYHDASGVMTPQEAHNDYLELLSSGGLVGLAIGIWFMVSVVKRARENFFSDNRFQRSVCFAALLGLTGVAVHSMFDFGLHLLVNAFVFLILIMLATTRFVSRAKNRL